MGGNRHLRVVEKVEGMVQEEIIRAPWVEYQRATYSRSSSSAQEIVVLLRPKAFRQLLKDIDPFILRKQSHSVVTSK